MKNLASYKTTVTSAISAAASLVIFLQELHYVQFPTWVIGISVFASVGGLATFGILAKDYNATGGTVPTTAEAVTRVDEAK